MIWLKLLLKELKMPSEGPMKLYYDNKVAISIAHHSIHYNRTKHMEIACHLIKDKIKQRLICITYICTNQHTANTLTKGLPRQNFKDLTNKLGMLDIFS